MAVVRSMKMSNDDAQLHPTEVDCELRVSARTASRTFS